MCAGVPFATGKTESLATLHGDATTAPSKKESRKHERMKERNSGDYGKSAIPRAFRHCLLSTFHSFVFSRLSSVSFHALMLKTREIASLPFYGCGV
jgi:hypothetical protein